MKCSSCSVIMIFSLMQISVLAAEKKRPRFQEIDPTTIATPIDQEVCFAPDEPCDLKLKQFADAAEKSIDMAIYDINLDELVHVVLLKSKKIPVRVIVDQRQAKGSHSLVETLIKGGVQVRYGRQRGIMHDKFVVIDGKGLELGSFNYTNHAATANQENQLYLFSPKVVERYKERFEKMWSSARLP